MLGTMQSLSNGFNTCHDNLGTSTQKSIKCLRNQNAERYIILIAVYLSTLYKIDLRVITRALTTVNDDSFSS